MKYLKINTDNINEDEIDEIALRAKALIINSKNEVLLGYGFNTYQFIGGHIKENEVLIDGLLREIEEETGIKIINENIMPFMKITHYTRNYRNKGKNRKNTIYYYVIYSDQEINLNNLNYDEWERKGNFEVHKILLNNIEKLLISTIPDNDMNGLIVCEMLEVLKEYKKTILE